MFNKQYSDRLVWSTADISEPQFSINLHQNLNRRRTVP